MRITGNQEFVTGPVPVRGRQYTREEAKELLEGSALPCAERFYSRVILPALTSSCPLSQMADVFSGGVCYRPHAYSISHWPTFPIFGVPGCGPFTFMVYGRLLHSQHAEKSPGSLAMSRAA